MPNPNTISTFKYQDIQIPDGAIRDSFVQYMSRGQYVEALNLLETNAQQLQGKAYVAEAINKIASGVLELEQLYNSGVPVFLSELAQQYKLLIDNLRKKGKWTAMVYQPYSFVYDDAGDTYMCIKETINNEPLTSQEHWVKIGLKGETGDDGLDVSLKYNWAPNTEYFVNDLVVFNDTIYVAKQDNINSGPDTSPYIWGIFILISDGYISVGKEPPAKFNQDTIWFKTSGNPLLFTKETPKYGQFCRYVESSQEWENLYPNTTFTLVDDYLLYANTIKRLEGIITIPDWNNNKFIHYYSRIGSKKMVTLYPYNDYTSKQLSLYNKLKMVVNENEIVLTLPTDVVPDVDLPIQFIIQ